MATKEEILDKHLGQSTKCYDLYSDREIGWFKNAMEEYANQECAAKDAEIKSILAAVARGDDLAFSLAFDGELSTKQKLEAEIKRLKGLIEKAHDSGYNSYEKYSIGLSWLGFKTDNNL